jgi:hypothetical protein
MQPHQFDLVISRTHIPRSKRSLAQMASVALYYDNEANEDAAVGAEITLKQQENAEMPIAWAFLGFDGSLSTLHVEPEHRGRGLAVLVGWEVMRVGMGDGGIFESGSSEEGWAYADVAMENVASRRVMEKMGGVVGWTVSWVVIGDHDPTI